MIPGPGYLHDPARYIPATRSANLAHRAQIMAHEQKGHSADFPESSEGER